MSQDSQVISVLAVNCPLGGTTGEIDVTHVDCPVAALQAVRAARFDLLLSSARVGGEIIWPLAQKLRRLRPKLHWWLVADVLEHHDEIRARSLGVNRIIPMVPTVEWVCTEFRRLPLSIRASNAPPGPVSVTTTGVWPKLVGSAGGQRTTTGPPETGGPPHSQ